MSIGRLSLLAVVAAALLAASSIAWSALSLVVA
jgi:hypothetical protein